MPYYGQPFLNFLLIIQYGGRGRTRTYEGVSQRIYSPPPLPLGTLSRSRAAASSPSASRGRYMVGARRLVNQNGSRKRYRLPPAELPRPCLRDRNPACENANGRRN